MGMEYDKKGDELKEEEMQQAAGGIGGRGAYKSDIKCPQCGEFLSYDFLPRLHIKTFFCNNCGWKGLPPKK